VTKTITYSQHF